MRVQVIDLRATEAADVEIRALAVEILRKLQQIAPAAFGDFYVIMLDDGTEIVECHSSTMGWTPLIEQRSAQTSSFRAELARQLRYQADMQGCYHVSHGVEGGEAGIPLSLLPDP